MRNQRDESWAKAESDDEKEESKNDNLDPTMRVTRSLQQAMNGKNYLFYKNSWPSRPDGDLVDNIHKNWFGNYDLLEAHHG